MQIFTKTANQWIASPSGMLWTRSLISFISELRRCETLQLDFLVSHPGNFMDDRASGIARNAAAIGIALEVVPGRTRLLMETTAGSGYDRLGMMHLNDSKAPFASRRDRHELIGEGAIGEEAFRRIMTDDRLATVPKVIETPKGDEPEVMDTKMLNRLRGFAAG